MCQLFLASAAGDSASGGVGCGPEGGLVPPGFRLGAGVLSRAHGQGSGVASRMLDAAR